jgi:hypothetical protein
LCSDANLQLAAALGLPTFEHRGSRWYRRAVLFVEGSLVRHAIHPLCSPLRAPGQILCWLKATGHPLAEPIEPSAPPTGGPLRRGTSRGGDDAAYAARSQSGPARLAQPWIDATGWPARSASDDDAA